MQAINLPDVDRVHRSIAVQYIYALLANKHVVVYFRFDSKSEWRETSVPSWSIGNEYKLVVNGEVTAISVGTS